MITRGLFLFGMMASATVLAGCGTTSSLSQADLAHANRPMADASENLAASADRVAGAVETLARVEAARTPPVAAPVSANLAGVPDELRRSVILNWSGPGEEVVQKLAAIVGYTFIIEGNPPATRPLVNVSFNDAAAIQAFQDVGNQVGPFAQVLVSAPAKEVRYRYLNNVPTVAGGAARPGMTK